MRFFDTSNIDAFAAQVVQELTRQLPPAFVGNSDKQAGKRQEKLDDKLHRMVEELHRKTRLNFYQKARIGGRIQDAMEAAGYSAEFSKALSYQVVLLVAQPEIRRA